MEREIVKRQRAGPRGGWLQRGQRDIDECEQELARLQLHCTVAEPLPGCQAGIGQTALVGKEGGGQEARACPYGPRGLGFH